VDPSQIVTLNDYAPNQGPADFYRNENNFYRNLGDPDTVMQPSEALAPGFSAQVAGDLARTTPPIASTAYAQYYASTFMDFDAAVAFGNKIKHCKVLRREFRADASGVPGRCCPRPPLGARCGRATNRFFPASGGSAHKDRNRKNRC